MNHHAYKCQLVLLGYKVQMGPCQSHSNGRAGLGAGPELGQCPQAGGPGQWQQLGQGLQPGWQHICRVGSSPLSIWLGLKVMSASNWALSS